MLARLSGRSHEVLTAVALARQDRTFVELDRTTVWMDAVTPDDITWYVASGEPRDKAGAYAIQGLAARFIPRIEGSWTNVVGLPIATVHKLLKLAGAAA
jgi:septum formation protein